jgi:DNA primase
MTISPSRGAFSAPESLSTLIEQVDLYTLVERYAGPGRSSGNTVTYSCPNPAHPDYSPSFTVSLSRTGKQSAKCWSQCDWQGDALDLVAWLEGISTAEAAQWIRKYLGKPDAQQIQRKPEPHKKSLTPVRELDTTQRPPTERAAHFLGKYLTYRSWPLWVVEQFALEVVLDNSGECRVRHPYFTPNSSGEWIMSYWQDRRRSSGQGPKWLSPKGGTPTLHNLKSLERDGLTGVVICEGPADTITATVALEGHEEIAVIGVPGVSAWRKEWSDLLEGLRIVVAADNDEAGRKLEEAVATSVGKKVRAVRTPLEHNDLTDTAKILGLDTVRSLLLSALQKEPEFIERSLDDSVRLLLSVFPEAFSIEEGAA